MPVPGPSPLTLDSPPGRGSPRTTRRVVELTNMVNAGSLLETLSGANVDLVLHGHEHEHNFALVRLACGRIWPVMVIAAGSATGNQTLVGCVKERVTFQRSYPLARDRSVRIVRYWFDAESWRWMKSTLSRRRPYA